MTHLMVRTECAPGEPEDISVAADIAVRSKKNLPWRWQRSHVKGVLMRYEELLKTVREKLPMWKYVTANVIQMRYRCLQMTARKCISDLQQEGLIGTEWNPALGGYPVLTGEKHGIR